VATYRAAAGLLVALEDLLKRKLPAELSDPPVSGTVRLLSSADLRQAKTFSSVLGIWLHRIQIDPNGRNTWRPPDPGSTQAARPVMPVNLHVLLMSWGNSASAEAALHAWGMQQLSALPVFDAGQLAAHDPDWQDGEKVQIAPEEIPTEDLLRIWDALPTKYTLTSCWVLRTARVAFDREDGEGLVRTRVLPVGSA
jgi:hypothetical protein